MHEMTRPLQETRVMSRRIDSVRVLIKREGFSTNGTCCGQSGHVCSNVTIPSRQNCRHVRHRTSSTQFLYSVTRPPGLRLFGAAEGGKRWIKWCLCTGGEASCDIILFVIT